MSMISNFRKSTLTAYTDAGLEERDQITDVEFEKTNAIEFCTPKGNKVLFQKVRHGHWAKLYADHQSCGVRPFTFYCSVCHEITAFKHKFCPNCGTQMDEVTE